MEKNERQNTEEVEEQKGATRAEPQRNVAAAEEKVEE